jgi:gas vesicle protein
MVGGAALGAIAVALTTPKTGKEIRNQLVALRDRYRGKAKVSDQTDDETVQMQFI